MIFADIVPASPALFPGDLGEQPEILLAVLLTVAVETPLFFLAGYRRLADCLRFALVNVISNLLLNESLTEVVDSPHFGAWVLLGEVLVLALEFTLCRRFLESTPAARLFRVLLLTNAASFLAGLLLFG
ncbi:MAG: hypothetical protein IJS96_09225 [Schwartzia sp.]|nr:hypothetical protein [Schwartzia sp. (in: firmicutes)]